MVRADRSRTRAGCPRAAHDLLADIAAVFHRHNRASDGTAAVENTYLETVTVVA